MPKEAFGGDDDSSGGGVEEKKKMGLSKFELSPDVNIRDVFWKIMGAYAATKKPGVELKTLENDRFALMRAAVSILTSPHNDHYGLSPRFIATYSIMMMIDGGWRDVFAEFLGKALEDKHGAKEEIAQSIRKLLTQERYRAGITDSLTILLRARGGSAIALYYIAMSEDIELIKTLKKELIIIARGDIGENQLNAIKSISLIKEDEEIKKSLIILLSHWDAAARLAAAEVLEGLRSEADVRAVAEKRLASENDQDVKKVLQKIVNG